MWSCLLRVLRQEELGPSNFMSSIKSLRHAFGKKNVQDLNKNIDLDVFYVCLIIGKVKQMLINGYPFILIIGKVKKWLYMVNHLY